MTHRRHILWRMIFMNATVIFAKRHIKHPMQIVFDTPVRSDGISEGMYVVCATDDIIAHFLLHFSLHVAIRTCYANAL